jgi:hypothetical protein
VVNKKSFRKIFKKTLHFRIVSYNLKVFQFILCGIMPMMSGWYLPPYINKIISCLALMTKK